MAFERLTLYAPRDGRPLVKDLSLSIPAGVCLLVRSTSESAEKALFRATADLWYQGEGRILHPGHDEIFFLPERPYLPPGTLREVLLRTGQEKGVPDWQIRASLKTLNLEHALVKAGGLDAEQNWARSAVAGRTAAPGLRAGAAGRAALRLPGSPQPGLSECPVGELLNLLRQQDITYLTLGDAADDPRFYDRLLEIADDGSWRLRPPGASKTRRQQRRRRPDGPASRPSGTPRPSPRTHHDA